ncbi:unnamed protein product, partial [Phaeothamnion confervicola]
MLRKEPTFFGGDLPAEPLAPPGVLLKCSGATVIWQAPCDAAGGVGAAESAATVPLIATLDHVVRSPDVPNTVVSSVSRSDRKELPIGGGGSSHIGSAAEVSTVTKPNSPGPPMAADRAMFGSGGNLGHDSSRPTAAEAGSTAIAASGNSETAQERMETAAAQVIQKTFLRHCCGRRRARAANRNGPATAPRSAQGRGNAGSGAASSRPTLPLSQDVGINVAKPSITAPSADCSIKADVSVDELKRRKPHSPP